MPDSPAENGNNREPQPPPHPISAFSERRRKTRLSRLTGNLNTFPRDPQLRLPLNASIESLANYGTVRSPSLSSRQSPLSPARTPSPRDSRLPHTLSQSSSFFRTFQRPKSTTYDHVLENNPEQSESNMNGIRFWYSTFTSIDWLHDHIKDSTRTSRMRRRQSVRGRISNLHDRSLGWIVVSIVGFLTAICAFLIIKLEQWLFDIKEGYCNDAWWKAKRFCCPTLGTDSIDLISQPLLPYNISTLKGGESHCLSWTTWAEHFAPPDYTNPITVNEGWWIEYLSYGVFALLLAFASAILTTRFTASTSFSARTDSSVPIEVESSQPPNGAVAEEPKPAPYLEKRKVMYFAAGSGIPELKVILGGFVIRGYLGGRTLFIKSVGLSMSVASGLTLGKEGPFVHIASCLGNIVSRWFIKYETNEAKRREILSAAAAAGVAVAFGAPVGGVLFSLEEVSYFFPAKVMWRSFFCAMIAATTLKILDPFGTGKLVLFQVTYDKDWHAYELLPFLLLGLFGGVFGAYFTRLHVLWVRHVRSINWVKRHPVSEVMAITLLTTILGFLNPYTRMGGTELVYNLFAECQEGDSHEGLCVTKFQPVKPVIMAITIAMIIKAALTTITFGIKVPAGIFIPSLGVGACFGRIVGLGVQYLQWHHPKHPIFELCQSRDDNSCIIPGLYAMVGAAASLSGVTRTTISLAVIMFELTRTMNYVVPVMLAVLVAKNVADFLEPAGIYDAVIELSQLPYLDSKHDYLWGTTTLNDVMDSKADVIRADHDITVRELQRKVRRLEGGDSGFPIVVKEDGMYKMLGYISQNELEHALTLIADDPDGQCRFEGSPYTLGPESSISSIAEAFDAHDGRDLYDFSVFVDQAPLTVNLNSPLEVVHRIFTKLGALYLIVTNSDGFYEGVIDKKAWIGFVNELPSA